MKIKVWPAKIEMLPQLQDFLEEEMEQVACPMKCQVQIQVAIEELFVNVCHYAYDEDGGEITVKLCELEEENGISISLIDSGKPFDPLAKEDPDVTLCAEEREIGGLGIYMVKKSMDAFTYQYENGCNVIKIVKKW